MAKNGCASPIFLRTYLSKPILPNCQDSCIHIIVEKQQKDGVAASNELSHSGTLELPFVIMGAILR